MKHGLIDIEAIVAQLRPRRLTTKEALLAHLGILRQALLILPSKRRGYSGTEYAFNNFYSELISGGLPEGGAWRRYMDKLSRMQQLAYGGYVDDLGESLIDVFRDKSNYDAITSLLVLETMLNEECSTRHCSLAHELLAKLIEEGELFMKEGVPK